MVRLRRYALGVLHAANLDLIVALDPGKNIGVAFVSGDGTLGFHAVVTSAQLETLSFPTGATVLVGDGTGSDAVQRLLKARGITYEVVDEWGSSLTAGSLYFRDHPPKGLQRFLPRGMRTPPELIDDYAAYALALAYLTKKADRSLQP